MVPVFKSGSAGLGLGAMDHYTLVVDNAFKTAEFHVNYLGFHFQYKKSINTGTVQDPEFDMLNYILTLPANPNIFCVITQGLNEDTVFWKYYRKFGEGIHHIAFQVDDLTKCWELCEKNDIPRTSDEVIMDPVSGLKQFFIVKEKGGYFIELIERTGTPPGLENEDFTAKNMKKLSDSIKKYL